MALLYSISSDQENQLAEATVFLSSRWTEVLEEKPVVDLCESLSSSSWTAESFEVQEVEVGNDVRVRFTFEAKGLDRKSKPSGDRISGSALAVIDEYDGVRFLEVATE
jgi:hypothetical protein